MSEAPKAASAAQWKKAKVHEGITLPSGTVVSITVPNLPHMVSTGAIPNKLMDAALKQQAATDVTEEALRDTWDFIKHIVPKMVVSPKITEDDVEELPIEDVEMLAGFATRNSDIDAVGHHLGGLETVKSFRELRGIISFDEAFSG